jgi:hypothetical protein
VCRSNSKGSLKGAEPAHTSQDLRPVLQLPAGGIPGQPPVSTYTRKIMRIEQDPHRYSNVCRMSSGSGASKSSGTLNSPTHHPKERHTWAGVLTGLTSATGRPAQAMITGSPLRPTGDRCRDAVVFLPHSPASCHDFPATMPVQPHQLCGLLTRQYCT